MPWVHGMFTDLYMEVTCCCDFNNKYIYIDTSVKLWILLCMDDHHMHDHEATSYVAIKISIMGSYLQLYDFL